MWNRKVASARTRASGRFLTTAPNHGRIDSTTEKTPARITRPTGAGARRYQIRDCAACATLEMTRGRFSVARLAVTIVLVLALACTAMGFDKTVLYEHFTAVW